MTDAASAPRTDFKRTLPSYRAAKGRFAVVEVPDLQYLMIDGQGDPNSAPAYTEALAALYPVAYALRSASRSGLGRDYVVPPLEGLWWADDMDSFAGTRDKSRWRWTMMLLAPEWIDAADLDAAVAKVADRRDPSRLGELRLETLSEGSCVQTLHVGSFDDEGPVLQRMHDVVIPELGLRMVRRHHEIYLSDARRVTPERMRTILRQPVVPV